MTFVGARCIDRFLILTFQYLSYTSIIMKAYNVLFYVIAVTSGYVINKVKDGQAEDLKSKETIFDQILRQNKGSSKKLFEGDIDLLDHPVPVDDEKHEKRSVIRDQESLWTTRIVPYELTPSVESGREMIMAALQKIEQNSCIKFVGRTKEKNWVRFVDGGSCHSLVGRKLVDGPQEISLSSACTKKMGTVLHEVLHALGFWHEQSRPDRDKYIEIMWENIDAGNHYNFHKSSLRSSTYLETSYDYHSIMHYGSYAFSKNGEPTIKVIGNENRELGQRESLSEADLIRLNALYRCEDIGKTYTAWSEWGPCDGNCRKSRQRFCPNFDKSRCPEASRYGVHTAYEECSEMECYKPVDGHWGRWTSWSGCDHECGKGKVTRTRQCNDPPPKYGGSSCQGDNTESKDCTIKPCSLNSDSCLFENQGIGFWEDASKGKYRWERHQGTTISGKTGPSSDHTSESTTKDGHYMFAESSFIEKGSKAILISRTFPPVHSRCMRFFYSMYGSGIGALYVFLKESGVESKRKMWEMSGDQGEGWNQGEIDISSHTEYQVVFEAERGDSFLGDIGLDDILFAEGTCSGEMPPTTPTTETISPDYLSSLCGVDIKPLGCFADSSNNPTMEMLGNHRDRIVWKNYGKSLKLLLCDCLKRAKDHSMIYVGLQYYGECWASQQKNYNRFGSANTCIDSKYNVCNDINNNDICISKGKANYVYQIL